MDASRLEKRTHGTESFPFQIYPLSGAQDGDVVPLHWHPELEIIRIVSGEVGLTIGDKQYLAHEGDIFFVAMGELHEIRCGPGNQFRSFVFSADFLEFRRADRTQSELLAPLSGGQLHFRTVLQAGDAGHAPILAALDAILAACGEKHAGYELLVKASLLTLVAQGARAGLLHTADASPSDYHTQLLRDIVEYLNEHCTEPLRLPAIASHFGMSPQYFCTFFKAHLGRTFVQHVNFLRIERASRLLRETDQPIMEVGFAVGFENFSYFIKRFREVFGCTPSAYRKAG